LGGKRTFALGNLNGSITSVPVVERTSVTTEQIDDLGRRSCYEVVEATSAEEALRKMRNGLTPDLLVTDHLMPGKTGTELVRQAWQQHPSLSALIVSGDAEAEEIAPDLPRLTKPFRQTDLAASVAKLVDKTP
jgi:CheY-like chemotaxis protein